MLQINKFYSTLLEVTKISLHEILSNIFNNLKKSFCSEDKII